VWQNHVLDIDLMSRPFVPVRVDLESPKLNSEAVASAAAPAIKNVLGEFRKLPFKVGD
jgi:hypothetical protein